MKEVVNFYAVNTIALQKLQKIPKNVYADIIKRYEESDKSTNFQDFLKDNTWILVDEGYRKIKDYDVFQNKRTSTSFFNKNELDYSGKFKYFEPLFNEIFLKDNKLNIDKLHEWIKKYVTWGGKATAASYKAIVDILPTIDEEEAITMIKSLFLYSFNIDGYSYFELLDKPVPTLEEVKSMLTSYMDCSEDNPDLEEKYNYINSQKITADEIKETLKAMLRGSSDATGQKRILQKIISMKNRKIIFNNVFNTLNDTNKTEFCNIWQQITGK